MILNLTRMQSKHAAPQGTLEKHPEIVDPKIRILGPTNGKTYHRPALTPPPQIPPFCRKIGRKLEAPVLTPA
jgi:hypothetical protein